MNRQTHVPLAVVVEGQLAQHRWHLSVSGDTVGLTGLDADRLQGPPEVLFSGLHADDADVLERILCVEPTQRQKRGNLRLRHADGRIRCCRATWSRQPRADGGLGLSLTLEDARGLARTMPDPAQMVNFRAMMENTTDYVYFKDRNHVFTGASQSLVALCDPAEHWTDLIGLTDYDVFPEHYADIYYRLEKQVFSNLPVAHEIQQTLSKDGRRGWVDNRKFPIRDDQGEIIGLYGMARDITALKEAEEALRKSERQLRAVHDSMNEGMAMHELVLDAEGRPCDYRIVDVNPAFETMTGLLAARVTGLLASQAYEALPPPYLDVYAAVAQGGPTARFDAYFEPLRRHFLISVFSPGPGLFVTVFQDISAIMASERRLRRLSQLYEALSLCNQAIVRSRSDLELFERICSTVVTIGGMKMAWIGLVDPQTGRVKPVAAFGEGTDYLDDLQISVDPEAVGGRGPTGSSIRDAHPVWCQDFQADPRTVPWHERGVRFGWGGSAAIPLFRGGQAIGALTLYAAELNAFDDQVQHLLIEMAQDIGFALDSYADAEARRQAEDQLRKLSMAVDQSPESIVITNLEARIEYVNAAFLAVTGYAREEVIGRNPRVLHSGRTPRSTYDAMWADLTAGRPWMGEFFNRRKDGTEYTELAIISPVRQPDGRVSHYVAVKQDISERKKIETELEQHRQHLEELVTERTSELTDARQLAEAANQAKSTFLATMSHEIRTPMNAIIGFAHLLKRRVTDPRQLDWLQKISMAGHHLLAIINDILDFSKIEAGKLVLAREPTDLRQVVEQVVSVLEQPAKEKGLRIGYSIEPMRLQFLADSTRLTQALLNLANNAVKFTERGEVTIRLSAIREDPGTSMVRIEVADTGRGIPPEMQARLFQPFEQGETSVQRSAGGTGLGLAITRRLARLMGGDAGCSSQPGQGSTFWFTACLEVRNESAVTAGAPALALDTQLLSRHAGRRVLIVEDEPLNQQVIQVLVEELGLVCDVAVDGREALECVAERGADYAAILMDVRMPRMNGLDATRELRRRGVVTPIIAVTANAFDEDRERCIQAGMNDFVSKPISQSALAQALDRQL